MQQPAFDSKEFRRTLGTFTTGVTIITACGPDSEPVGVTANSFSSVSLDPPLVLWSLAKSARSLPVFEKAEYFAIHILAAGQEDLSNRFASRGEDKFAGLAVERGLGDTPLLPGCCARLQCKTVYQYEGGDHLIFVGEVIDLVNSDAPPLVFQAGKYALASRKTDEKPLVASATAEFTEDFLGYLLWRAYFQFQAELRKQETIAGYSHNEFLLLVTLFHKNWRYADALCKGLFHDGGEAEPALALASLQDKGMVERRTGENGKDICGLTEAGRDKALAMLGAAKSTESTFLEKLGDWESVALKNLLKGFIVETDPGLPHPWERAEGEAEPNQ